MFVRSVTPAGKVVTFDYRAAGGHRGVVMCAPITSLLKDHPWTGGVLKITRRDVVSAAAHG